MSRLTLRDIYATLIYVFAAFLISLPVQAAPNVVNAADSELPGVARGVPMGGPLRVHDIDLDQVGSSDLTLERFRVFEANAELNVDNLYSIAPPTDAYFRGRVDALPDSIVVLAVPERGPVRGVITDASGVWLLAGKSGHSAPGLGSRKLDLETELAGMRFECGAEGAEFAPADLVPAEGVAGADTAPLATNVTHTARVAVETDYEYYAKFGNETAANQYMGDVFAYASTVYEREVNTNLVISWSRLWTGGAASDPWAATSGTSAALDEFQAYWNSNNPDGSQRTIAHMLSGKDLGGGIAYLAVLCNNDWGYGVSANMGGTFDIDNPSVVWDLLVVSHEIGHNFGSPHTHDYCGIGGVSDPVDLCVNSANSCGGALGLPGIDSLSGGTTAEKPGTIMSYCDTPSGGFDNISFTFGQNHIYGRRADRVPTAMYSHVLSQASSYPGCLTRQTLFDDVPTSYWAFDWIETLGKSGITSGCDANNYCPQSPVTRASMAIFLERGIHGSGYIPPTATGTVFSDVSDTYWAASWIEQLSADGITGGCGGGNYCPGSNVTRAQMAVFLLRSKYGASYIPPLATGTMFDDVSASHWAAPWIEQLAKEGITSGCDANNYCPAAEVKRDQMAIFLVRAFNL